MPSVSEHKLKTVYGIPAVILLHVLCPERKGPYIRCTKLPDSSPLRNAPERHGPNARHRTFRGTWRSCEVKLGRLLGMLCAQVCPGWVNYPKPGQEIGGLPGSTRIYQDLTSNRNLEATDLTLTAPSIGTTAGNCKPNAMAVINRHWRLDGQPHILQTSHGSVPGQFQHLVVEMHLNIPKL